MFNIVFNIFSVFTALTSSNCKKQNQGSFDP